MCLFCVALPLANSLDLLATHDPDADEENEEETPIYEKFDPLLHRDQGRSKRYSGFTFTGKGRMVTNLENLEYSEISLNMENSGNSQGILCNLREKI